MDLTVLLGLFVVGYFLHNRAGNSNTITNTVQSSKFNSWQDLKQLAESQGFTVTSSTGGNHAVNSKHYLGLAIDVRTRDKTNQQVNDFIQLAKSLGITVYDERTNIFNSKNWTAPHLHLQI